MSPLSTSNEEAAYLWITHQHPRHQPTQEEFVSKLLQWQVKEHDDDGEEEIRQVQSGVRCSVGRLMMILYCDVYLRHGRYYYHYRILTLRVHCKQRGRVRAIAIICGKGYFYILQIAYSTNN